MSQMLVEDVHAYNAVKHVLHCLPSDEADGRTGSAAAGAEFISLEVSRPAK
jgi:hypothetical protein